MSVVRTPNERKSRMLNTKVKSWSLGRWASVGTAAMCMAVLAFAMGYMAPPASADEETMELDIELPDPSYVGSPLNYTSPRLEPMSWRKRDPIEVPAGTENVALDKEVTASVEPRMGTLDQITNGEIGYADEYLVELPAGPQWVQIDLEQEHEISAITAWHFFESERVYFDIVVQVSNDPEFEEDVTTIFNNDYANELGFGEGEDPEYIETHQGRLFEPEEDLSGRYVRLWSNGNNWNDYNHYIEVQVYGRPL